MSCGRCHPVPTITGKPILSLSLPPGTRQSRQSSQPLPGQRTVSVLTGLTSDTLPKNKYVRRYVPPVSHCLPTCSIDPLAQRVSRARWATAAMPPCHPYITHTYAKTHLAHSSVSLPQCRCTRSKTASDGATSIVASWPQESRTCRAHARVGAQISCGRTTGDAPGAIHCGRSAIRMLAI